MLFLISFEIKVRTCFFRQKEKTDQSLSLQKYIFMEFCLSQLTRDHV